MNQPFREAAVPESRQALSRLSPKIVSFAFLLLAGLSIGGFISYPTETNRYETAAMQRHFSHIQAAHKKGLSVVPFLNPAPDAPGISSQYGDRFHPILGIEHFHTGIDFPLTSGSPVVAAANGLVVRILTESDSSGYGIAVMLAHDEEFTTVYAHLSKVRVRPDQLVLAGDTLGLSGTTGRSTNPHLHFEVRINGTAVDPQGFLPPLPLLPPSRPTDTLATDSLRLQLGEDA